MTSSTAHTLSQSDVFCSLDEAGLDRLASACARHTFGAGEIVFLRGDPGDGMYVVESGSVAVSLAGRDGRDVLLAVLGPGESFGELAVVDGGPRVATVTARSRTVLVVVPRAEVVALIGRVPSVAQAVLRSLAATVRRLDEQATDAVLLDLPRRVEKLLAAAVPATAAAAAGADGLVPVDLGLSQGDLARRIGGSRQQVNRVLIGLEASGSIQRDGHRITAVRPGRLFSGDSDR